MKILVVDDEALLVKGIRFNLKSDGYEVITGSNGQEAVDLFRDSPAGTYQLILMDVMMPRLNGLEATHQIRTMGKKDSKNIPIVAVSANAFDEDIKRSLASGMNAHLSKPVEPDKLAEVLSRMLE